MQTYSIGRVATRRDEGGRRLIDGRDLAAFPAVRLGDVAAGAEVQAGPHRPVSLLSHEAVEELGPEVGARATARA